MHNIHLTIIMLVATCIYPYVKRDIHSCASAYVAVCGDGNDAMVLYAF